MEIDTAAYQRVLGDELRTLRKQRGWTRKELNRRLQSGISLQTLATYELGTRQCSVIRLVEICHALDVPAYEVLQRVHEKVFTDPPPGHIRLDLTAIAADDHGELLPLRRWARDRLDQLPLGAAPEVHLDLSALEYMAQLCQLTPVELIRRLRELDRTARTT
ncbi:helix-turn-helix transcriptional regulator [Solihabitans fulvus]|uniref:Helix-turn-helix transcriptional regulator n=1 Tax=Solihabitans fulvus TaxID=1892852 RepID=A0A5B2XE77_9PSEU|nr:helix-turn-helix transcriptional regulator [Solihabitans fulvus]KAA2261261.1 helix-turn-helix transcriptional regulator [Solihabitans fulvus]